MRLFIIVLIISFIFILFVRYIEKQSIFFPDKELVMQPHRFFPSGQDIYFTTKDGIVLNGWFLKNKKARATVLFFMGTLEM